MSMSNVVSLFPVIFGAIGSIRPNIEWDGTVAFILDGRTNVPPDAIITDRLLRDQILRV